MTEHAYAAVAVMVMAAAFASAAGLHAYEAAQQASGGGGGGSVQEQQLRRLDTHVRLDGTSPALASLTVSNAGRAAVVSANATACGASGLLGRAAGDGNWSLRPGSAATVSWVAPCPAGPALVRVEYRAAGGAGIVHLRAACAGGGAAVRRLGRGRGRGKSPRGAAAAAGRARASRVALRLLFLPRRLLPRRRRRPCRP